MTKRAITSIGLFVTLLLMPLSALIAHVTHGYAASHTWLHIHVIAGIAFAVFGILHVIYNWKVLKRYLCSKG